jgi:drug/metabolite transporter (DMT)-like permease
MILAATLLWAVEVILVKRLLVDLPSGTLAAARMALGAVLLVAWVAATGKTGQLVDLSGTQWRWVLLTGLLLTGYVAAWYAALARAPAVDVTAVLVFGAVVTAVLSGAADGVAVSGVGIVLVTAGTAIVAWLMLRDRRLERASALI